MLKAELRHVEFIIGMFLLVINPVVGWGSIVVSVLLARKTSNKFYYFVGAGMYVLSWFMALLGIYLAGPHGLKIFINIYTEYGWKAGLVAAILSAWVILYFVKIQKNSIERKS